MGGTEKIKLREVSKRSNGSSWSISRVSALLG